MRKAKRLRLVVPARAFTAVAAISLAACAGSEAREVEQAVPKVLGGPVSHEVRSWGRLLERWQVNPDGSGELWRIVFEGQQAMEIRKFRFRLDGDSMQVFIALVEPLRAATQRGIKCEKQLFDAPYGAITWDYPGASQTYAYDDGCFSRRANAALERIGEVGRLIGERGAIESDPFAIERAGAS